MNHLLHISSSPRGAASESLRIASAFIEAFRDAHPDAEVDTWDLWDGSLPEFGAAAAGAKMMVFGGQTPQGEQAAAWRTALDTFARFDGADRLLFSAPMWNGGVPYILKQFIDVISQPGLVFEVDPQAGYTPLLAGRGKRAAVVYTSAVWGPRLGPEFGRDFQSTYFTDWLHWTGIGEVDEIRFHPPSPATPTQSGWPHTPRRANSARRSDPAPSQYLRQHAARAVNAERWGWYNATNAPC